MKRSAWSEFRETLKRITHPKIREFEENYGNFNPKTEHWLSKKYNNENNIL